jgi:soluble lytic murein transglycosylase-like protein
LLSPAYRGAGLGTIAAFALLTLPLATGAQVIEIDSAGGVKTYAGPTAFHADGSSTPIQAASGDARGPRRAAPVVLASATPLLAEAASNANLSADLLEAVAWRESRLRPNAVSPAGAIGVMQLMPGTARALGVDPYDTLQNVRGGATYLSSLLHRYNGDLVLGLAAYNAGPGAVDKYRGVPPFKETREYVSAILDRLSWRALTPTAGVTK